MWRKKVTQNALGLASRAEYAKTMLNTWGKVNLSLMRWMETMTKIVWRCVSQSLSERKAKQIISNIIEFYSSHYGLRRLCARVCERVCFVRPGLSFVVNSWRLGFEAASAAAERRTLCWGKNRSLRSLSRTLDATRIIWFILMPQKDISTEPYRLLSFAVLSGSAAFH